MLQELKVKNFALIEKLNLEIEPGFSVITGETGAGKSILLGALGHLLGQRADLKALRDKDQKCVIEGDFNLSSKRFKTLFENLELDFEEHTIIRREILASGKSRAFVNDSPVRLEQLSELAKHLIDIHSQHDTLLLNDSSFQLELIDSFGKYQAKIDDYQKSYHGWKDLKSKLVELEAEQNEEGGDRDYLQFLFEEISQAKLVPGEQEELEHKLDLLENAGTIEEKVQESLQLADLEPNGLSEALRKLQLNLQAIAGFDPALEKLSERASSLQIEFEDLRQELESFASDTNFNPTEKENADARLSLIIQLQKKHSVENLEELIAKGTEIESKILRAEERDLTIKSIREQILLAEEELKLRAKALTASRQKIIPELLKAMQNMLADLNLSAAQFDIQIEPYADYRENGKDKLSFFFSANPGMPLQALNKVASGGELSRVMLALKAMLSKSKSLPTIIFDEIDTGVSGETALKIAKILKNMGQQMQVISISHLAQIASKAEQHYKVEKRAEEGQTRTTIKALSPFQREEEIARLLSGDDPSAEALANARALLKA